MFSLVLKRWGYQAFFDSSPNASGSLRNGIGMYDTLSRNVMCSNFMHMIFAPFIISSGAHFIVMALFKINCKSKALALCAIAITLLAQGRDTHMYANRSPTGSFQFECCLAPHREQSSSMLGKASHSEQNCCTQTRFGSCKKAVSEYLLSCVVSK